MKITWNWLSDYVDLQDLTPEQVAHDLTHAGIPVEWMKDVAPGVEQVVVGLVLSVESHPNADRLHVCRVDVGTDTTLQIVCGATNVAAGQRVPVALIGATMPGIKIKKSKLRGVESEGMICSATELGLEARLLPKEQTVGILVLPHDAPIGESIVTYLGLDDKVMELELTPNRSDCLSLRGVAYEVAAIYGREVNMMRSEAASVQVLPEADGTYPLQIDIATPLCSSYSALAVADLQLGPSPIWMQMRLLAVGARSINNLVDITNYVMYEWGQPLHAFDYQSISEHQIIVRQAHAGETLVTLDDQDRMLQPEMVVIADPLRGLGLAGVMGGLNSEVTTDTRAVVLESAIFDPLQTRRTSKRLQLHSEAVARFEKGVDPLAVSQALTRAAALMVQYAHGRIVSNLVSAGQDLADAAVAKGTTIRVRPERVATVLGYELSLAELQAMCGRLHFSVQKEELDAALLVSVPARRQDLRIEEDMIEEFARLQGYDRIPSTMIEGSLTLGRLTKEQQLRRFLRERMIAFGLQEVWTYSFVAPEDLLRLRIDDQHYLAQMGLLLNQISDDRRALRTTLLLSLLQTAQFNINHNRSDVRIFEIGTVFHPHELPMTTQPLEMLQLAGLMVGRAVYATPHQAERDLDFFDIKGLVEGLLLSLGVTSGVHFERSAEPFYHAGQCANILLNGAVIGSLGKLHTSVARSFDLHAGYYFQLIIEQLVNHAPDGLTVTELPKYPSAERDLAFVVKRSLPIAELLQLVRMQGGMHLRDVRVFDVYTGEHVEQTQKSVAIHLIFRSNERTLLDEEVRDAVNQVISAVADVHGGQLRG